MAYKNVWPWPHYIRYIMIRKLIRLTKGKREEAAENAPHAESHVPASSNGIVVSHVSKSYGSTMALRDVNLTIKPGETFGLIGPDGAGKTTLFRIMASLLLPDTGEVSICGLDAAKQMADIRRIAGYMPGRFSLYQDLTVEENLNFFARIFGTTIEEGYDGIRAIYSQIEKFKNRKAGALSGGMKQKLALSCALIHQPQVLFLDEPTTGVDPVSRKELWDMLGTLKDRRITIVAATPYLDEVRRCERVAYIKATADSNAPSASSIQAIGTPDEVITRFKDVFCPAPLKRPAAAEGTPQEENAIEVSHLVKAFGTFRAVNDISFTVRKGEIFGFLGANGAGKTTAMHMLTGLNQPTSGQGRVLGYDIASEHELIKRHIGYMSQRFSLYEDMTVAENMRLFGGIYGMSRKEIKAATTRMLDFLDMTAQRDTIVGSMPLGWKQKVAFATSIMHHPGIVFLDEPTGGVDPRTRHQFWELIANAAQSGITVFVTTHYMDEAEYCDRISIMVDGKISAIGTPEELKARYKQPDMDSVFTHLARQAKRQ